MAMNPLLALFGQAVGSQVPGAMGEEILVEGSRQPTAGGPAPVDPYEGFLLGNADAIRERDHAAEIGAEAAGHEGMFGTKGTLRNILGVLGDAFLIQSGNKPMYAPRREQERLSDALAGFTRDPMAGIERAAGVNPALAQQMLEQQQQNQVRQATLASQDAARRSQIQNRNFDNAEVGLNRVARWVAAGLPYEQIIAGAARYNIAPEELAQLGVTPDMTDEQRQQFAAADMTTNQIRNLPLRERQLDISQQNADTSRYNAQSQRMNATRPRATPRPRADTELEYYRQISDIPEARRSPEQKAFMKRYLEGTRGSGRSVTDRRQVSPPTRTINGRTFRIPSN